MKNGRYAEGERNRQAILDYVNAHPWAVAPTIISALGMQPASGATRLAKMTKLGELERRPAVHIGGDQRYTTYAYRALVKVTRPMEEVLGKVADNVKKPKKQKHPAWLTRNVNPDRPARKCPDAMHSGSRRVYISSSAEFV